MAAVEQPAAKPVAREKHAATPVFQTMRPAVKVAVAPATDNLNNLGNI